MSTVRYSPSTKADALHQVHIMQGQGYSRRGAVQLVAAQLGCRPETLNAWLRRDSLQQRSQAANHDARVQQLEHELLRLMQVNAALRQELAQLEHRAKSAGDGVAKSSSAAELQRAAWAPPSGRR